MGDEEWILAEIASLARAAGAIALRHFGRVDALLKADASYVTEADRRVEEFIRRELAARFPDDAIVGEEYAHAGDEAGEYTWAIDPIDGTTNYVAGLPHWAVCIARIRRGRPVLGVTFLPVLDEVFTAAEGAGAAVNGHSLRIVPEWPPESERILALWSTGYRSVDLSFNGKLRILGSTVVKFLNMARGSYIGAITPSVHVWDVASGIPVLREAGGEVRRWDGVSYDSFDMDLANGFVVPPLVLARAGDYDRVRGLFTAKR